MADGLTIVIDADSERYKKELAAAERATERFTGRLASALGFGHLTRLGLGVGASLLAVREGVQLLEAAFARIGDIASGKASSGIKAVDQQLIKFNNTIRDTLGVDKGKTRFEDLVDRTVISAAFLAEALRSNVFVAAENLAAGEEFGKTNIASGPASKELSKILEEQGRLYNEIGKTKEDIFRDHVKQLGIVSGEKDLAETILGLYNAQLDAKKKITAETELNNRLNQANPLTGGGGSFLDPTLRGGFSAMVFSLPTADFREADIADAMVENSRQQEFWEGELRRAQQGLTNLNRSPQLAFRGSAEEGRIVNAARNQDNPQQREILSRMQEQVRIAERQLLSLQLIADRLNNAFDIRH